MKLLITGASGFIGQEVQRILSQKGVFFETSKGYDLLQRQHSFALIQRYKPTHLLHLAWYTKDNYAQHEQNLLWCEASKQLLELFTKHGGQRFVGVGTCFEYVFDGTPCLESQTSSAIEKPHTLYGQAKLAFGRYLESFATQHAVSWAWARPFYVFGATENPSRLIPSAAKAFACGKHFATNAIDRRMDYIDVTDAADILVNIMLSNYCGSVNIGTGQGKKVQDILTLLGGMYFSNVHVLPAPPLDTTLAVVADTQIMQQFKQCNQLKKLESTLKEYVEVYK